MTAMYYQKPDLSPKALDMSPASGIGVGWGASNFQVKAPLIAETSPLHADEWEPTNPYVELCGCTPGKWAVTYDDGPLDVTPKFLTTLASVGVKATFFVIGSNVPRYADNLKAAYQEGHQIGIHTWTHPYSTTKSTDSIVSEAVYTAMAIYSVLGVVPRYWRPPHGDIDNRVRAIMGALGLRVAMWNVDALDWSIGEGPIWGNHRNWTAENATKVLDGVFQNGFYANYWSSGGDISDSSQWANLSWLPGPDAPYTGFISLEHDLNDADHTLAASYLSTIFNTPYPFLPGGPGKFSPALVHECDTATTKGPYMDDTDPFYNMVTYWYSKLPVGPDAMASADGFPTDFSKPLVNATVSPLPITGTGAQATTMGVPTLPTTAVVTAVTTATVTNYQVNGESKGRRAMEWVAFGAVALLGLTVLGL
ncbi:chitin deacetylase [Irineochytrium annulatum]|nr:chitin deacetylase [Irineochytrium annulatum]